MPPFEIGRICVAAENNEVDGALVLGWLDYSLCSWLIHMILTFHARSPQSLAL